MNDLIKRTEDSLPLSDQTTGAKSHYTEKMPIYAMFDPKV